jgi:hypothetical protein
MKIRRDTCFISCALFTIALLCLVPSLLSWAALSGGKMEESDTWFRAYVGAMNDAASASLVVIAIALIVLWTGYIKRSRAAWFVMFVVVWAWAFPQLALPLLRHRVQLSFSEWLYNATYQSGPARTWAESVLLFIVMLFALLLPIRSFFASKEVAEPSRRVVLLSLAGLLLAVVALLVSIHLRVYELPMKDIMSLRELPSPPPPPNK